MTEGHSGTHTLTLMYGRMTARHSGTHTHSHWRTAEWQRATAAHTHTHTDVRQQQPGLRLPAAVDEGVGGQAQDVGVVEELVHLHLRLGLLPGLPVVAQDPLQGVEAAVLDALQQVHVAEPPGGKPTPCFTPVLTPKPLTLGFRLESQWQEKEIRDSVRRGCCSCSCHLGGDLTLHLVSGWSSISCCRWWLSHGNIYTMPGPSSLHISQHQPTDHGNRSIGHTLCMVERQWQTIINEDAFSWSHMLQKYVHRRGFMIPSKWKQTEKHNVDTFLSASGPTKSTTRPRILSSSRSERTDLKMLVHHPHTIFSLVSDDLGVVFTFMCSVFQVNTATMSRLLLAVVHKEVSRQEPVYLLRIFSR